jgi:hypothetical protein
VTTKPFLLLLILFTLSSKAFSQKVFKSDNHYVVTIPINWNLLDNETISQIRKAREEQSGIKTKGVVTEAIVVKGKEFTLPNMQFLFNGMNLSKATFSEFVSLFNKNVPKIQKVVLKKEKISDKIFKSDPSKPIVDYEKNMYLYVLKQDIAGIGIVIITSANFMANHGIITVNITVKSSEFDKYSKTIIEVLRSLKIESIYKHQ